jgi:hypothetical protein
MLGTNRQFESLLRNMDHQITTFEAALATGEAGRNVAPALEDLWAKRRALKLLLLNRRVEASKSIVDFVKWRDGNGALYLCATPPAAAKRAAR